MYGMKKKRMSKRRWIDKVEMDIRSMGKRNWRQETLDRRRWNALVKEVKGHTDL